MPAASEQSELRVRLTRLGEGKPSGIPYSFVVGRRPFRMRWVLRREFLRVWTTALAVRSLFLDESGEVGKLDSAEQRAARKAYSVSCRRGVQISWKIGVAREVVTAVGALFLLLSLITFPLTFWDPENNLGRFFLAGELLCLALVMVGAAATGGETVFERVFPPMLFLGGSVGTLLTGDAWTARVGVWEFAWYEPLGLAVLVGTAIVVYLWSVVLSTVTASGYTFAARRLSGDGRADLAFLRLMLVVSELVDRRPGECRLPSNGSLRTVASEVGALCRDLEVLDTEQRRVVASRFSQAAEAVREKALWVALPKPDTQAVLRKFVVDLGAVVLLGTYDGLPTVSDTAGRLGRRRLRRVFTTVRSLVIAAVPLGVLLGMRLLALPIPGSIGPTATLVAALWAIVSLLMLIDPAIRERIDVAKNISSLFTAAKSEK